MARLGSARASLPCLSIQSATRSAPSLPLLRFFSLPSILPPLLHLLPLPFPANPPSFTPTVPCSNHGRGSKNVAHDLAAALGGTEGERKGMTTTPRVATPTVTQEPGRPCEVYDPECRICKNASPIESKDSRRSACRGLNGDTGQRNALESVTRMSRVRHLDIRDRATTHTYASFLAEQDSTRAVQQRHPSETIFLRHQFTLVISAPRRQQQTTQMTKHFRCRGV